MIIISSQKTTILDCDNGKIENCMIDYDEEELIAICDKLPDEQILIAENTVETYLIQQIRAKGFLFRKQKSILQL